MFTVEGRRLKWGLLSKQRHQFIYQIKLMMVDWFVSRESDASGGWPVVATPNGQGKRLAAGQSA